MILIRPLMSVIVRCFGWLIRVSNSIRRSAFLIWSIASLLKQVSSLLKMRSSFFSIIEIISKHFKLSIIIMNARNPFTSTSNYSFIRNAQNLSREGRQTRTYSNQKKYFDYQSSYLKNSHLRNPYMGKSQEVQMSRVISIQALRYLPLKIGNEVGNYHNSKAEYYNLQSYGEPIVSHFQQPLAMSKTQFRLEKSASLRQSHSFKCRQSSSSKFRQSGTSKFRQSQSRTLKFRQSGSLNCRSSERAMRSSTKDMFGSDYFNDCYGNFQSEDDIVEEQKMAEQSALYKKQPSNVSKFKVSKDLPSPMKQTNQSRVSTSSQQANGSSQQTNDQYQTLFLKSRGRLFYLYCKPTQ